MFCPDFVVFRSDFWLCHVPFLGAFSLLRGSLLRPLNADLRLPPGLPEHADRRARGPRLEPFLLFLVLSGFQ